MINRQAWIKKSRLGGLRRVEMYGNPGTPEGRSKGGRRACEFFRLHPDLARQRGFVTLKEIKIPPRSVELAKFIGIMLGDGGIRSKYQLTISFNYKTDREFAEYVTRLIKRLFAVEHIISKRKDSLGADIIISSASVIDFLLKQGLKAGNKIKNQVDIPAWIKRNMEFQKACLRGLVDTDGSLYCHRYKVNNKWYNYLKLDFTSCSKPLLRSANAIFSNLGIRTSLKGVHITVSAKAEVNKYLATVGSSNTKFLDRWMKF
ncbi:MAG: LAGLIDADG family homing endonuclease [Candidatus Omnitrophota bacterium]|nr:LAGLIDADG family homing endonuclease [Candidatus Omnitrophota bacterium]